MLARRKAVFQGTSGYVAPPCDVDIHDFTHLRLAGLVELNRATPDVLSALFS